MEEGRSFDSEWKPTAFCQKADTTSGGVGGGTYFSSGPASTPIQGPKCFPDSDSCRCESLLDKLRNAYAWVKETSKNIVHTVGCSVNTFAREYQDAATDLVVKVPGGVVSVERIFYENQWRWEHSRNNLELVADSFGGNVSSISKGGIPYKKTSSAPAIYSHDTYRILETATGYRWTDKRGNWQEYDSKGRLLSFGNLAGVVGRHVYEPGENGRVTGIADRDGTQVIWFEYDAAGDLVAAADQNGRRVDYTYTDGRLAKIKDAFGQETINEYDAKGRIVKTVDSGGRPTFVTYDSYGNVSSVLDRNGVGHFFEFDYDEAKKESYARMTTSSGMIKEMWYDKDGHTRRVDVNGRTVQKIVKDGRNLVITDEKGNTTRKEYDEWDNLTRVIYPDGSAVSFEYDLRFNKVRRVIDLRGHVTTFEYDGQGNLVHKVEAVGTESERLTTYTCDGDAQLLTATGEGDANTVTATTSFTYDARGNVATITDPEGNVTQFLEYDEMGNLLRMKDPRNHEWTFGYDAMARLITQRDPLNNATAYEYDGANNRTAVINAYLKRFEFEYDDHNNLIKAKDPYEKSVLTQYNTDNLPVKVTDQEGKETFYEYDNEGRLLSTTDGNGNKVRMEYTENAGQQCVSCGEGGRGVSPSAIVYPTFRKELKYDARGRKVEEKDILGAGLENEYITSFGYDPAGNLSWVRDKEGRLTRYEYDELNRLEKVTDPEGNVTSYVYDVRGNLRFLTDAKNQTTEFRYDRANRLVKEIRPMGQEVNYQYDAAGNLVRKTDAKGQKTEYGYDEAGRLTATSYFRAAGDPTPVKTVTFAYDNLGNLTSYDKVSGLDN